MFISQQFKEFLKQHNINHRPVTPYWPQGNGEVERFNRTIGKLIQCAVAHCNWRFELAKFLLQYRTTPHSATGQTPADMIFKYQANNDLPSLTKLKSKNKTEKATEIKDRLYKEKIQTQNRNAEYIDIKPGEQVLCQNQHGTNKTQPFYETQPYAIDIKYTIAT